MLRNSTGAMHRMGRNTCGRVGAAAGREGGEGRGAGGFTYPSPSRRYYPTSPSLATGSPAAATDGTMPQFYQTVPTMANIDMTSPERGGEEQVNVPAVMELPHHLSAATTMTAIKSSRNSMQVKPVFLIVIKLSDAVFIQEQF